MRNRYFRSLIASLLTAVLMLVTSAASAADQNRPKTQSEKNNEMTLAAGDALIARPLGLLSTIFGAAVFVVSLPFTLPGGNAGEAADSLVGTPADYTFGRPLGELDEPLDR